jgi:hypothetical protein
VVFLLLYNNKAYTKLFNSIYTNAKPKAQAFVIESILFSSMKQEVMYVGKGAIKRSNFY